MKQYNHFEDWFQGETADKFYQMLGDKVPLDVMVRHIKWLSDSFYAARSEMVQTAEYSEEYDSYFLRESNEWVEAKCSDPNCEFCVNRPERPLP
jgi:hypothetical protein